jgi:hypothetical protein
VVVSGLGPVQIEPRTLTPTLSRKRERETSSSLADFSGAVHRRADALVGTAATDVS